MNEPMTDKEARAAAAHLGIRYDGIQETRQGSRHQFTDIAGTGTTFYAGSFSEAKKNLAEKRRLFERR